MVSCYEGKAWTAGRGGTWMKKEATWPAVALARPGPKAVVYG